MSFTSIYTFGAQHYKVEDGFALLKVDAMRIDTFQRNIPIYYLLASSRAGELAHTLVITIKMQNLATFYFQKFDPKFDFKITKLV
jgi:hypothetical protein